MRYNIFINRFIFPLSDMVLGLSINKELKKWRKLQWLSKDELQTIQHKKLKDLLIHCSHNIPYYKNIADNIKFSPNADPVKELKKFPFLDKQIIKRSLPADILDKNRKTYFIDYTSGSSGIQGAFYSDKEAYSIALAIQSLWWNWTGYEFGDRLLQTGMTLKRGLVKGLKDFLFRVKYIQAFHMDSNMVMNNLSSLRGTKDYYLMGYASSLYTYAKFTKENEINDIQFKAAVSWGDKMFPDYRKLIESQFNTVVFDTYAACEGTMIAAECEYHNYHIMTPHVFIEILDKNGNEVELGEMGEVVVTRLDNYLMPLIRYKIGDLAVKADPEKKCPCGRSFPLLGRIIGRDTDIIYTPGGKSLIVHFFTGIFEFVDQIQQFQVIQHSLNDIEIKFILSDNFSNQVLVALRKEIFKKANEKFPLRFTEVSKIPPTASGKPQIVISNINKES